MYKAADAVLKDNNEMGKAKTLAQDRAEACAVIVQFLTSLKGGLRSAVGGYIRYDHWGEFSIGFNGIFHEGK